MRAGMWLGCFEFPFKAIDGWQKFILTEIRKSQKKISSFVAWVAGKHLFEQPDGVVEFKFRLLQNTQSLQYLKIFWSSGQRLLVGIFRRAVVPGVLFSARLFKQRFNIGLCLLSQGGSRDASQKRQQEQCGCSPPRGAAPCSARACRRVDGF